MADAHGWAGLHASFINRPNTFHVQTTTFVIITQCCRCTLDFDNSVRTKATCGYICQIQVFKISDKYITSTYIYSLFPHTIWPK